MLSLSFFASMNGCLWLEEYVEFNFIDITFYNGIPKLFITYRSSVTIN
jgi:hypothetical protein